MILHLALQLFLVRCARQWMEIWGVEFADNVSLEIRKTCETYGRLVISTLLAGGFGPPSKDLQNLYHSDATRNQARDWLAEVNGIEEYRERWIPFRDFVLEIAVLVLIGWEIHLGIQQERLQAENFKAEKQLLSDLSTNTKATADELSTLQKTNDAMHESIDLELAQSKRNAAAAERSAKAAEDNASVAKNALQTQKANFTSVFSLVSPLKAGDATHVLIIFTNTGRTPATDFKCNAQTGLAPSNKSLVSIREDALKYVVYKTQPSTSVVGPGQSQQQIVDTVEPLTQETLNALESGGLGFYVFAEGSYNDFEDRPHKFEACARYEPSTKTMVYCSAFNKFE